MNPPIYSRFQTWFKIDPGLRLMNDQAEKGAMAELSAEWGCPWRPVHACTTAENIEIMERALHMPLIKQSMLVVAKM